MSNKQPDIILNPFCYDGDKTIPSTTENSNEVNMVDGIPKIMSTPLELGGKPIGREAMNGALFQTSEHISWLNKGNWYEYSADIVNNGGYNKGAKVYDSTSNNYYISLVDNNISPLSNNSNWTLVPTTATTNTWTGTNTFKGVTYVGSSNNTIEGSESYFSLSAHDKITIVGNNLISIESQPGQNNIEVTPTETVFSLNPVIFEGIISAKKINTDGEFTNYATYTGSSEPQENFKIEFEDAPTGGCTTFMYNATGDYNVETYMYGNTFGIELQGGKGDTNLTELTLNPNGAYVDGKEILTESFNELYYLLGEKGVRNEYKGTHTYTLAYNVDVFDTISIDYYANPSYYSPLSVNVNYIKGFVPSVLTHIDFGLSSVTAGGYCQLYPTEIALESDIGDDDYISSVTGYGMNITSPSQINRDCYYLKNGKPFDHYKAYMDSIGKSCEYTIVYFEKATGNPKGFFTSENVDLSLYTRILPQIPNALNCHKFNEETQEFEEVYDIDKLIEQKINWLNSKSNSNTENIANFEKPSKRITGNFSDKGLELLLKVDEQYEALEQKINSCTTKEELENIEWSEIL